MNLFSIRTLILLIILFSYSFLHAQSSNDKARAYYMEASSAYKSKNYTKTLEYLGKTEEVLGKTNARILNLRIKAYYENKEYEKAKECLNQFSAYSNKASESLRDETLPYIVKVEEAIAREEAARLENEKRIEEERIAEEKRKEAARLAEIEKARVEKEQKIKNEKEKAFKKFKEEKQAKLKKEAKLYFSDSDMVFVEGGTIDIAGFLVDIDNFYISKYEITREQWNFIMPNRSVLINDCPECPISTISWYEAQQFIKNLNEITDVQYRLPTEAEWIAASRGGVNEKKRNYSGGKKIDEVGWYLGNSNGQLHKVGQKTPNKLGLYDMTGNVIEWCNDWHVKYKGLSHLDPNGPPSGTKKIARGGSVLVDSKECTIWRRWVQYPSEGYDEIGFRLAKSK